MLDKERKRVPHRNKDLIAVFQDASKFDEAVAAEIGNEKRLVRLARSKAGHYVNEPAMIEDSRNRRRYLRKCRPWAICPKCNGHGCLECGDKGWMNREVYRLFLEQEHWRREQIGNMHISID